MPAGRENRENRVSAPKVSRQSVVIAREEIASRAYLLYLERGETDGHDVDDWLQAEEQITREKQERLSRPKASSSEAA